MLLDFNMLRHQACPSLFKMSHILWAKLRHTIPWITANNTIHIYPIEQLHIRNKQKQSCSHSNNYSKLQTKLSDDPDLFFYI